MNNLKVKALRCKFRFAVKNGDLRSKIPKHCGLPGICVIIPHETITKIIMLFVWIKIQVYIKERKKQCTILMTTEKR